MSLKCESPPVVGYGASQQHGGAAWKQGGRPCDCFPQPAQTESLMYVQPEMREPFKPVNRRCTPKGRQDYNTMYKEAYRDYSQPMRESMVKHDDTLKAPEVPFAGDTTYADAYKHFGTNDVLKPILPERHRLMGCGPFETETTNKHDFPPQPYSKMEPKLPEPAFTLSEEPMNAVSTMDESYQPPDRTKFQPASPCIPSPMFKLLKDPMDGTTTFQESYQPQPPQGTKPIIPEDAFKSTDPFAGETTYNSSFKPANEDCSRDPIRPPPSANIINFFSNAFDDLTLYKEDYPNRSGFDCRLGLILPKNNLKTPDVPFLHDSTNKIDFHPWGRVPVVQPIVPPRSCTLGRGPIDFTTTHKLDFNPADPAYEVRGPFTPDTKCSWAPEGKQTGNTTMSDSYKRPDMTQFTPAQSCKRALECRKNRDPFNGNTTQKLDYLSWPNPEKLQTPWADKAPYHPEKTFEGNSTYTTSFTPPGYWVPGPTQKEWKPCGVITGCYCKFPGECCHTVANTSDQIKNEPSPPMVLSSS